MNKRSMIFAASARYCVRRRDHDVRGEGPAPGKRANDADIARYAQSMLEEGRKTFRSDTFGSEAFWETPFSCTRRLRAPRTAASAGVSPETALAVGQGRPCAP
jgi:hypothetical protein